MCLCALCVFVAMQKWRSSSHSFDDRAMLHITQPCSSLSIGWSPEHASHAANEAKTGLGTQEWLPRGQSSLASWDPGIHSKRIVIPENTMIHSMMNFSSSTNIISSRSRMQLEDAQHDEEVTSILSGNYSFRMATL